MATVNQNLSEHPGVHLPQIEQKKFALVVADWNKEITSALLEGARGKLLEEGAQEKNIYVYSVPGSFELSLGAQWMAQKSDLDVVICLGCIIQGETRHFEFIASAVALGITEVGLKYDKPVVFGVLTTDNLEQAKDRAGGKHGNKGEEAAYTALKMLAFRQEIEKYC